jgi:hypothetical protein
MSQNAHFFVLICRWDEKQGPPLEEISPSPQISITIDREIIIGYYPSLEEISSLISLAERTLDNKPIPKAGFRFC